MSLLEMDAKSFLHIERHPEWFSDERDGWSLNWFLGWTTKDESLSSKSFYQTFLQSPGEPWWVFIKPCPLEIAPELTAISESGYPWVNCWSLTPTQYPRSTVTRGFGNWKNVIRKLGWALIRKLWFGNWNNMIRKLDTSASETGQTWFGNWDERWFGNWDNGKGRRPWLRQHTTDWDRKASHRLATRNMYVQRYACVKNTRECKASRH